MLQARASTVIRRTMTCASLIINRVFQAGIGSANFGWTSDRGTGRQFASMIDQASDRDANRRPILLLQTETKFDLGSIVQRNAEGVGASWQVALRADVEDPLA